MPADRTLRESFDREGVANCRWGVRVFCAFAVAMLAASAIDSWFSEPDQFAALLRIRVAAAVLLVFIAGVATYRPANPRWLALWSLVVMSVAIHALAQLTGGQSSPQYERLAVIILGMAILMSWGPLWSVMACGTVISLFMVGSGVAQQSGGDAYAAHLGYLMVASVVTVSANLIRERRRWRGAIDAQDLLDARAASMHNQQRYEMLVETAGSAIVALTLDRSIVEFNREAEAIYGYRREEVLGRDYVELFQPNLTLAQFTDIMERAAAGEGIQGLEAEVMIRSGDHRMLLWNVSRTVGQGGEPIRIVGIGQDITDRKRAEDEIRRLNAELEQRVVARTVALRASEARFRTMFEAAPIGVVTVDAAGAILHANPAFERMLGCDDATLRTCSVFDLTAADDRPRTMSAYSLLTRGRTAHVQIDKRYVRHDGEVVWVHEAVASVRDADGNFAYALCMVDDVTERKRAEDRAREHGEQLAHLLRVNTMGEMAAELAHEINQPLGAIVNYANGISVRLRERGVDTNELGQAVGQIAAEGHRAAEIIRRVRDFIRRGERQREPADLNHLIREAAHLVEPDARRHTILLRLVLDEKLPLLAMDRIQVEQVVLNLLRNGIEAMVAVEQTDNELLVQTVGSNGEGIVVMVRDTGVGLPAAAEARIFDPFFTTKTSGLGMGLSISRSIVEAHGGRLWAERNADRGMTFGFTLPSADSVSSSAGHE